MVARCDDRDPELDIAAIRKSSNPEWLSKTKKRTHQEVAHQHQQIKQAEKVLHFLHKLKWLHDCGKTVQVAWASSGSNVILNDFKSPGAVTISHYRDVHLQELRFKQNLKGKG